MHFTDKSSFYSFVVSAFINEARKENVTIYLDYTVGGLVTYDIYLPEGLSILGEGYQKPYMVEIKYISSPFGAVSFDVRSPTGRSNSGTRFIVFGGRYKSLKAIDEDNTVYLGEHFLEQLAGRNSEVYLNYLLGDTSLSFKKHSDDTLYLSSDENKRRDNGGVTRVTRNIISDYKIEKADPDKICKSNENDFMAFLRRETDTINCALIIGNGVSIPFGSDNWSDLIKNLVDRLEPFYIEKREHVENALSNSSYALSSFVKRTLIREESMNKYMEALRYCIYRKYNEMMHDQKSLVKVIALAKDKFPSIPLLTYNYDTFIEKQYFYQTNKDLKYYYSSNSDVDLDFFSKNVVAHLHGYISYTNNNYSQVVLTDEDYCNAYLDKKSWTRRMQIEVLKKYNCLFVGSSMSDLFQMSLVQEARNSDKDGKWNCFALMCLKDLDLKEKMQIIKFYKEKGIRLIIVKSFDKMPGKLAHLFGIQL